jgi:hypothetical protein
MSLGDLPVINLVDDNTPGPIASFNQGGFVNSQWRWYNLTSLNSHLDSPDTDIRTYMVVVRNITVSNAPSYFIVPFPYANST